MYSVPRMAPPLAVRTGGSTQNMSGPTSGNPGGNRSRIVTLSGCRPGPSGIVDDLDHGEATGKAHLERVAKALERLPVR